MLALADSLQREPTFVSQLVRFAIYGIACNTIQELLPACEWTDEQLAAMQSAVAKINSREALTLGMAGERAMGLSMIDTMPSLVGFTASNKRELLRIHGLVTKSMEKPWHDAIAEQKAVSADIAARQGTLNKLRYSQVSLLIPAFEHMAQSGARNSAQQICTIAALAAQRLKLIHGDFPASLAEIAAEFLPTDMANSEWIDPFTGKPLGYSLTDSGLTIYSAGSDLIDNEGDVISGDSGQPTDVGLFLKR